MRSDGRLAQSPPFPMSLYVRKHTLEVVAISSHHNIDVIDIMLLECRCALPEGHEQGSNEGREALFMLDSGAGGADIMMNLTSGLELGLVDSKKESGITTTVRVGFQIFQGLTSRTCKRTGSCSKQHLLLGCSISASVVVCWWSGLSDQTFHLHPLRSGNSRGHCCTSSNDILAGSWPAKSSIALLRTGKRLLTLSLFT